VGRPIETKISACSLEGCNYRNEIVLGSSYARVWCANPAYRAYWRTDQIVKLDMKPFGMLHDRFMAILTMLHVLMTMKTVHSRAIQIYRRFASVSLNGQLSAKD
jgi:hypothetical protein